MKLTQSQIHDMFKELTVVQMVIVERRTRKEAQTMQGNADRMARDIKRRIRQNSAKEKT